MAKVKGNTYIYRRMDCVRLRGVKAVNSPMSTHTLSLAPLRDHLQSSEFLLHLYSCPPVPLPPLALQVKTKFNFRTFSYKRIEKAEIDAFALESNILSQPFRRNKKVQK